MRESIREQKSDPGHQRVSEGESRSSRHALRGPEAGSVGIMADPARLPQTLNRLSHPGSRALRVQHFHDLQHTYGNRAVMRMMGAVNGAVLQRKRLARAAVQGPCPECAMEGEGALRPKLTTSQPGDRYEQEADRVAEQVMRMPDPYSVDLCQQEIKEEEALQGKELPGHTPEVTPEIQAQISTLQAGGSAFTPLRA
jgi:hypothetical protein